MSTSLKVLSIIIPCYNEELSIKKLIKNCVENITDNVEVLLVDNDGKVDIGAPVIKGAKVKALINDHVKGDKVIVFKKKRRKGYKKKNGHRQNFTSITIKDIVLN